MKSLTVAFILTVFIGCAQKDVQTISSKKTPLVKPTTVNYSWLKKTEYTSPLINRYKLLDGFKLVDVKKGSYEEWLRYLPMEKKGTKIKLYNGKKKFFQLLNAGVIKIDVGKRDLQQCADAVIRLRAEYLYSSKQYSKIHFNYTSGFNAQYSKWRTGSKIRVKGNKVNYYQKPLASDKTYLGFKSYLTNVFNYAGTYSLNKELIKRQPNNIKAGDVLIIGGFPGHVITVLAVSKNAKGEKAVLLGQSYMPAQSIHVIRNQNKPLKGAWFLVEDFKKKGWSTVEWSYDKSHLKTWSN